MAHGEHDHEHAEEFPRAETVELVGRSLAGDRRRQLLQIALVSLGVTAFALALPTEHVLGRTTEQVSSIASPLWTEAHLLHECAAKAVKAWSGASAERACFAVAAVALGASAAVLLRHAHRRGWSGMRPIVALLVAITAPVAWLAGTLPSAASCGLLGACILFSTLDADEEDDAWLYAMRASGAWFLATLLHAWSIHLWPALLVAVACRARTRNWLAYVPVLIAPIAWWLAFVIAWNALNRELVVDGGLFEFVWRTLLAGGSGGPGPLLAWSIAWTLGLGGAVIGIIAFARALGRSHDDTRPAAWVVAFAIVPIVTLGLGGDVRYDVPFLWLIPLAFVGLLDGPPKSTRALALIPLSSVAVLVAFSRLDHHAGWRSSARELLSAGDVVVTQDPIHAYVAGQRFELDVIDLSMHIPMPEASIDEYLPQLERALDETRGQGRRVVFDADVGSGWLDDNQAARLRTHADLILPRADERE